MEEITKEDVLSNLELMKKILDDLENYIKNRVHENGEVIEKGINGVIDYVYIILKGLINTQAISYGVILEDAKKKGLEKEFRVAYSILKSAKFIDYDVNNRLIIMGERTKHLIKLYNDFKHEQKERNVSNNSSKENINQNKSSYINVSMANEIYLWILDEINRNEWVSVDTVKGIFKGHDKEVSEAINRIILEGKAYLVDNKIYRKDKK